MTEHSQIIRTPRGEVEISETGEGRPLLIIHGTPGGHDQSQFFGKLLDLQGFKVVGLSRPGYLRTPLSSGETPAQQSDLCAALLAERQWNSACIVGISGGGPTAVEFAALYPKRCQALILVSAIAHPWIPPALHRLLVFPMLQNPLASQLLKRWAGSALARSYPSREIFRTLTPASVRSAGLRNDLAQFATLPPLPFDKIDAPVQVIHGGNDKLVPIDHARFTAKLLKRAEFHELPAAGHELLLTHLGSVRQLVQSFLAAL